MTIVIYARRELGSHCIMKARSRAKSDKVRVFKVPTLNCEATDYISMIDWHKDAVTEPMQMTRLFCSLSQRALHPWSISHATHAILKLSRAVCWVEKSDGFIRARLESREIIPRLKISTHNLRYYIIVSFHLKIRLFNVNLSSC